MYVIGIDLGTQSLKGLLVDSTGKIIAEASCAHDPVYPNPAWAEQVVADWIHSFKSVVHQLWQAAAWLRRKLERLAWMQLMIV